MFDFGNLAADVGHNEKLRVVRIAGDKVDTFFGQIHRVLFFLDNEVKFVGDFGHTLVVFSHVLAFGGVQKHFVAFFAEEFNKRVVFRKTFPSLQKFYAALSFVAFFNKGFCLVQKFVDELFLMFYELNDFRFQIHEKLHVVTRLCHRSADNKRCTRVVNQHRVNLIDDCKNVFSLNQLFGSRTHVVSQIVETELVVGTESNVGIICLAAFGRVGLVLVDTVNAKTVKHIQHSHPLGVAFCEVVVDCYHVYAPACQCVKENGECCHEGFTFTGCHLRDFAFVKRDTADYLNIVMNHVPCQKVAAGSPSAVVKCFVVVDSDIVVFEGEFAVKLGCRYLYFFILFETSCGVFYDCKRLRQNLVKFFFQDCLNLLFSRLDIVIKCFLFFNCQICRCF